MTCQCFARCEADCICDHDWTPPAVVALRAEIAQLQAKNTLLQTKNEMLREMLQVIGDWNMQGQSVRVAWDSCGAPGDFDRALAEGGEW